MDASRFERDETRQVFESETAAVIAFGNAVKMPLEDLTRATVAAPGTRDDEPRPYMQDKKTAIKYWGFKVGRALLMNAGEGINFQFVDVAFGGLGTSEVDEGRVQENVDPNEEEDVVEHVSLVKRSGEVPMEGRAELSNDGAIESCRGAEGSTTDETYSPSAQPEESDIDIEDAGSNAEVILMDDLHDEIADHMAAEDEDEDNEYDNANDDGDSDADDDDDGEITAEERQFMFQSASDRGKLREKVEKDVPCYSHTRKYTGHCNVKTVKDANFFGLQDEYVVSGSDGGHLFIWDKKTTELVNIPPGRQGGSSTLSKVRASFFLLNQRSNILLSGHPYEPLLAVSGIDHTIKIFSPDSRAQKDAEDGINISSATNGSSGCSSLSGRRRPRHGSPPPTAEESPQQEGLTSRKRMQNSYQIISQNDVQRQGGMRDAFITVRADGPFVRMRMVELGFAEWLGLFDG